MAAPTQQRNGRDLVYPSDHPSSSATPTQKPASVGAPQPPHENVTRPFGGGNASSGVGANGSVPRNRLGVVPGTLSNPLTEAAKGPAMQTKNNLRMDEKPSSFIAEANPKSSYATEFPIEQQLFLGRVAKSASESDLYVS